MVATPANATRGIPLTTPNTTAVVNGTVKQVGAVIVLAVVLSNLHDDDRPG
jgi:hypothetical protein